MKKKKTIERKANFITHLIDGLEFVTSVTVIFGGFLRRLRKGEHVQKKRKENEKMKK